MRHIALACLASWGMVSAARAAPAVDRSAVTATLIGRAIGERGAYRTAVRLADEVGARMAGTPKAAQAVTWAVAEMKAQGLGHVHAEPVTVEAWGRGADDRVDLVAPFARRLQALALGHSPPTPEGGITADVVEVASIADLAKVDVKGKIVFYDPIMVRSRSFDEYGRAGEPRFHGAIEAAKAGAVAAVIRSVGTGMHRHAHAGATTYDPSVPAIPYAALAIEDAMLLHRALEKGPAKLSLHLGCGPRGNVASANVVGEIRGRSAPDEVVLLGAHLDSWDVGDGAIDDGAGVGIVLDAARLIAALHPRRTVRVVLFMNEENGLSGAHAYFAQHQAELAHHVAALEADAGAGTPTGFGAAGGEANRALLLRIVKPLAAISEGATVAAAKEGGSDLGPIVHAGVPSVSIRQDVSDYFEWHHTEGDTADKIDPDGISRMAACVAVIADELAELDATLPRLPATPTAAK